MKEQKKNLIEKKLNEVIKNKLNKYRKNMGCYNKCYLCKNEIDPNNNCTFHAFDNLLCKKCYINIENNL